jgi:hypothetical protein
MSKTPPKKEPEFELRPDAWQRFERAVDAAIKSGPKHRAAIFIANICGHEIAPTTCGDLSEVADM